MFWERGIEFRVGRWTLFRWTRRRNEVPADAEDAWAFAHAMSDQRVRVHLAGRGFTSGAQVLVGRDRQVGGPTTENMFRVWRDPAVPGGWDGEVIER